jgi:hypothetical protein
MTTPRISPAISVRAAKQKASQSRTAGLTIVRRDIINASRLDENIDLIRAREISGIEDL